MNRKLTLKLAAFGLLLAACDSQVDETYPGEPLATIEGTIDVADGADPPDDLVAAVLWHVFDETDSGAVTETVRVGGTFPAQFQLELFAPPPDEAYTHLDGEGGEPTNDRVAIGYVAVSRPSALESSDMQVLFEEATGIDNDHILVYAPEALSEERLEGVFPGGARVGYQLFRVHKPDNTEADACFAAWEECIDACTDAECFEVCDTEHNPDECPPYDDQDTLERVDIDTEQLSIVLGGEKIEPDWF